MRFRGQSAIEFLSTYAFAFLVIGVALALLFVFSSIPQMYLPTQCTFYNGFSQSCDAIYYNTPSGANLTVIGTDAQPGVVNVSSFSAYINFGTSTSGTCSPTVALAGQTIYCTAQLAQKPHLGSVYTGTFNVKANYCANAPSNISNSTCPSSTTFYYSGSVRAQAAPYKYSGIFVVPITVTNSQTAATQGPFQQMIQFVPNTYVSHENSNLGNIRFYYGNRELASWCESNCTNSSTGKATFWVKLPSGIPASSSVVVNMYILPKVVNYDGIYAGQAPQSSPSYAKYDNAANVFNFYDNFNGTSDSRWTSAGGIVPTYNNGVSVPGGGGGWGWIYATYPISGSGVLDAYTEQTSNNQAQALAFSQGATIGSVGHPYPDYECGINGGGVNIDSIFKMTGSSTYSTITSGTYTVSSGTFYLVGCYWNTPSLSLYSNYATLLSASDSSYTSSSYIFLGAYSPATWKYQWVRIRTYPPSGIMPTTSFGAIAQLQ